MKHHNIGIHVLTSYPPSNPNRDENGSPKTAVVGGVVRQRISSQCIKRAWRLSEIMQNLDAQYSIRTRMIGVTAQEQMIAGGVSEKLALANATAIAEKFGSVDKKKAPQNAEIVVLGFEEKDAVDRLTQVLIAENRAPTEEELNSLQKTTVSLDVAAFGRMRAATPKLSVDASIYVSHPLTTNKVVIDADFWTSVDDLKSLDDDADGGAGGMGDTEFGSGSYYTYVQINTESLIKNLAGNVDLAKKGVSALIQAIATTSPSGHKTSFANEVRASYVSVEVGQTSGNLFNKSFENPVALTSDAIAKLKEVMDRESTAYDLKRKVFEFSTQDGINTLANVVDSVNQSIELTE